MSNVEKVPINNQEHVGSKERSRSAERLHGHIENLEKSAEQAKQQHQEKLEHARHSVEKSAVEHQPTQEHVHQAKPHPTKQQKAQTYRHTLASIQSELPTQASRLFSKVIHQPSIENISEVAGKTVFRPSLTLGAALGALLGGSLVYLVAKRYGFELSGSEFIVFAFVGAAIGLASEGAKALWHNLRSRSS